MQFAGPSHDSMCWSKVSTGQYWTNAVAGRKATFL